MNPIDWHALPTIAALIGVPLFVAFVVAHVLERASKRWLW